MYIPQTESNLYEKDFYAWTQKQVSLLESQQWSQLDLTNLIEEIEALGKQQRQELRNRLSILLAHLLKWEYQPQYRSRSWLATIRIQRRDIARLIQDNPSLKPYLDEAVKEAYENAKDLAMGETNLSLKTFPLECLYNLAEILDIRYYPGEPSDLID
ncbi:DUF29 domain-containing protein [Aphanothece hegewaldii CCALA 016]|uniref:DUF29 domain-containing protein n=1 Tax=Aphanothece hegewaldii CCALA 016 TaxID=2107694 RepID=A0A2T1LTQ5_9CHRO|nr:DUF29 domain-containing protein [Aphanothece hegewaldii]PSF34242.1 DUF29 domain-containing protein [Aphanothece hegewaldii CCALA 016]